jgi:uroporphyrinogen-III synthase
VTHLSCSLTPPARDAREREIRELLTSSLLRHERTAEGFRILLAKSPGIVAAVRGLVELEKQCCPFLDFEVAAREHEIHLQVRTPAEAGEALEELLMKLLADSEQDRRSSPLEGKRIVVTRPAAQAQALVEALEELGAQAMIRPAIDVRPVRDTAALDATLHRLESFDWVVFTSANGVKYVWERLHELGIASERLEGNRGEWMRSTAAPPRPRVAAIGPGTAAALEQRGASADYVPAEYVAEALARGLPDAEGSAILLLRSDIGRPALRMLLEERGASVDDVAAYRTVQSEEVTGSDGRSGEEDAVDAVTFTSPSAVKGFLRRWRAIPPEAAVVCIGPITARAATELGLRVDAVAESYTIEGLVRALVEHFSKTVNRGGSGPAVKESNGDEGSSPVTLER